MKILTSLLGMLLFVTLFFSSLSTSSTNAVHADARPTLTPTPLADAAAAQQTAVASIVLISDGDVDGLQTAVEWQDNNENWHVVEGWQSPFNRYKQVTWAVAAADYGKGPFRWVVSRSDMVIMRSSDFYLPLSGNESVVTHVMP